VPRRARSALPSGIYHVTSRGTNHCAIYEDDTDRKTFLTLLGSVAARFHWICHAFCLMTNHYHLIVETELPELSRGMRRLNGGYARIFNERHNRHGHLFGARYSAHVIDREEHLEASCLYVLENPVRAGLCERPSEWRWSGCRALGRKFEPVSGTVPFRDSPSGLSH
jgi:putative transposase